MKPGESCIACLPWLLVKQLYMPESQAIISLLYTFFTFTSPQATNYTIPEDV